MRRPQLQPPRSFYYTCVAAAVVVVGGVVDDDNPCCTENSCDPGAVDGVVVGGEYLRPYGGHLSRILGWWLGTCRRNLNYDGDNRHHQRLFLHRKLHWPVAVGTLLDDGGNRRPVERSRSADTSHCQPSGNHCCCNRYSIAVVHCNSDTVDGNDRPHRTVVVLYQDYSEQSRLFRTWTCKTKTTTEETKFPATYTNGSAW